MENSASVIDVEISLNKKKQARYERNGISKKYSLAWVFQSTFDVDNISYFGVEAGTGSKCLYFDSY